MSKVSLSRLMVLCAALAACTNGDTKRTMTAPAGGPAFSEAPADLGIGLTVDGPFDLAFATETASAQMAAAPQAASGGRASGHVGFNFSPPFGGNLASEQYSFVALGTDPLTPLAAKGSYELMLTLANGVVQKVNGDVICMSTVGNTTRVAGQITKLWVNNVQRPLTGATHNFWTVTDNGEGQGTADQTSLALFANATNAQFHCATGFTPPSFANQEGDVQVDP
jgi:hypothetical protein